MKQELVKGFKVSCVNCDTETTLSFSNARNIADNTFKCPVCDENLTAYVRETIQLIFTYNNAATELNNLLHKNDVISVY